MVGKLLLRGMLAGIIAGLVTFFFARVVGEPQVNQAIAFEQKHEAAHAQDDSSGHAHDHEVELVSRSTQSGIGLLTGVAVFGAALGGLFALTFAYAHGRAGTSQPRALAAWLALAAFVSLVVVPFAKYPPNPPSVGDPETIGMRTALYFVMVAISIAITIVSLKTRKSLIAKFGVGDATVVAGVMFVVLVGTAYVGMPSVNEVPDAFPADVLWKFRLAAIGMQAILWATIGAAFGIFVERSNLVKSGRAQSALFSH